MDSSRLSIGEYLDRTAAKQPTPGGGGVAGVVGALAAALGEMVLAYTHGSKDAMSHAEPLHECTRSVHAMRQRLVELADADAAAYGELNRVMKMDKDSPDRKIELARAALSAAQVPLDVIRVVSELIACFEAMSGFANKWLKSDLAMATIIAEAAARASRWNIQVNTKFMDGMDYGLLSDADGLLERIESAARRTVDACR